MFFLFLHYIVDIINEQRKQSVAQTVVDLVEKPRKIAIILMWSRFLLN